jgi:branched-chain amino acid transport system substrate-binding protein
MEMRRLVVVLVVAALVLVACAPAPTPTPEVIVKVETQVVVVTPTPIPPAPLPDVIKIGIFQPMTGVLAASGEDSWKATQIAMAERSTVLGRPVTVVLADDKSDKAESAVAMSRLIDQDKVNIVIGSAGSSFAMAGGEMSEKAGMPVVGTTCTNPLVTQGRPHYFRVCFTDMFAGGVMARYAARDLKAKTVAMVVDIQQDFCVGLGNEFRKAWVAINGPESFLASLSFQTGDRDFTAQLNILKAKNPDVVFLPDYFAESALLLRQAADLGMTTKFLGSDDWTHAEFLQIAGDAGNGVCFATHFAPEMCTTPKCQAFLKTWRDKYGGDPSQDAVLSYDAYMLVLDTIEKAQSVDRQVLTDTLAKTKDWPGIGGNITLDANRDAVKPAVILCTSGGKYVFNGVVQP